VIIDLLWFDKVWRRLIKPEKINTHRGEPAPYHTYVLPILAISDAHVAANDDA
jgi:hypothetical protein